MDTRQALQSRKDIAVLMDNERRIQASIEQSLKQQGADTKALNAEKSKISPAFYRIGGIIESSQRSD